MRTLKVLHIEDQERDAALIARHLSRAGYEIVSDRVDTAEAMTGALETREWDVILCDYSMPHFNALQALAIMKTLKQDTPFIIISGMIGEAAAVEAMRAGAHDYLMKDSLAGLAPAIERERTEAKNRRARRQSEEQLRLQSAAVQAAANAIAITDRAGKVVWTNPAFTQTTGYSFKEINGKNLRVLKSGKQNRAFYQDMWETILSGKVWHNTVINRRKDGTLNHQDLTITPICDDNTITHFIGIKQDITEKTRAQEALQASELRYRRLFESAKDGILILDAGTGQIIDVNPFLVEILGYAKEELIGKELWEIGVFKDVVASKAAFIELQSQGYIRYEDLPLKTHRGMVKQVEFVSNSYLTGPIRVIQCNIRDISERKLAEEALTESNQHLHQTLAELRERNNEITAMTQQLWQASKLATVGELAASIAHELNNPLATISLKLETLAAQLSHNDTDKLHSVKIVAAEVERMGNLVGNLLQFSRSSHQQASTVNVSEEIDKSLEFVEYHLRSNKIQIVRDYAKDVPTIQADRQQLRQVVLNLLTNASDAMNGGGTLTLTVAQANDAGTRRMVRIEFIDSGPGIKPADVEKIWDPFFTTKPEGKGTGLGLAICRRVIEQHRGSIAIESEIGRGTKIIIELPATNSEEEDEAKPSDASKRNG